MSSFFIIKSRKQLSHHTSICKSLILFLAAQILKISNLSSPNYSRFWLIRLSHFPEPVIIPVVCSRESVPIPTALYSLVSTLMAAFVIVYIVHISPRSPAVCCWVFLSNIVHCKNKLKIHTGILWQQIRVKNINLLFINKLWVGSLLHVKIYLVKPILLRVNMCFICYWGSEM